MGLLSLPLTAARATTGTTSTGTTTTVAFTGQIAVQDMTARAGSEPDTLTEPDVAVSPRNPDVAVAVAQDSRFPDGGAVAITRAWTGDGGRTWRHAPIKGLTRATGGTFARVSDPTVAFGPQGQVYVAALAFEPEACGMAVLVARSDDGGATFAAPVRAMDVPRCLGFLDKPAIAVDTGVTSPRRGRVVVISNGHRYPDDPDGEYLDGHLITFSDDGGTTWTPLGTVDAGALYPFNAQPGFTPGGTLVDVVLDESGLTVTEQRMPLASLRSTDGGRTWWPPVPIAADAGGDGATPGDPVRCCLPSATIDAGTGRQYAVWLDAHRRGPWFSASADGRTWTGPRLVDPAAGAALSVNVEVSARDGHVVVAWARQLPGPGVRWQQQAATSDDGGLSFAAPLTLGPVSDGRWSARAGGFFPGDYAGSASSPRRTYLVWTHAERPPGGGSRYHQVLYSAVLERRID